VDLLPLAANKMSQEHCDDHKTQRYKRLYQNRKVIRRNESSSHCLFRLILYKDTVFGDFCKNN